MRPYYVAAILLAALTWAYGTSQPGQESPILAQSGQAAASDLPDSPAWVYVYRYKEDGGGGQPVFCDERPLAQLDNGRYFLAKLKAGRHAFRSSDKQSGIELDLKAGQKYYIRVELPVVALNPHGRVILVPPEQGGYEVKNLRPVDSRKIKDKQIVVSPEQAKP